MTKSSKRKHANTWKKEEVKPSDNFMKDPKETDLVVPVMGATGAGKSTFINALVGRNVAKVGHDLQSETAQVQHYILPHPQHPDRRLVIVDTPGFDDTNQDDREILRRIAVWLAQSYDADMTLAGLIYLHEITQTRMMGTARKNLDMFNKLCGPNAAPNIILATTKWSEVKEEVGSRREEQLRATHWKDMISHGSRMSRFEASQQSAEGIVSLILGREPVDVAQIQQELVEMDEFLSDTEAGRTLRYTLKELLEVQKQKAARLREEGGQNLQEEIAENEEKIHATLNQIKSLNIPFGKRVLRLFRFR
ncbi:P-loop containing nucleoside triphosphate hydrolase protein [Lyophyllum atratum]|nr:P-loop containing nucleoside triphosphate hydrolase protein [Lyophyllum atratum]